MGYRLGPGEFTPGWRTPIRAARCRSRLTIRAKAALLFWPLCAVTPVLLASSLGKDSEDPTPLLPRRGRSGRHA